MVHHEESGKCLEHLSIHNRIFERIVMILSIKNRMTVITLPARVPHFSIL